MEASGDPPRVLNDRYEILRPLGQGGMGAVYLVYDRQEGREVALKSFPPAARRVEDLAHFEHEFLTLSRLRHPNVAEVYDFGVIEGTQDVFFTSEFIDGQDLYEVSRGLSEEELAGLLVQACRGLEYIHSRQIIHYDIKPSNILVVTRDGEPLVKLIDFGLAAQQVDDSLGIIKGTVSYLAPEVARHLPVDRRADLYSLGVTIFHCVTGGLPFRGETNLDVVRSVVSDEPPDPAHEHPNLTRGLRDLILRLLAKEPGARYQSGNEVIKRLAKIYSRDFATEHRDDSVTFVVSGGFFGRDVQFKELTETFESIFSWREEDDPLATLPPVLAESLIKNPRSSDTGFVSTSSGGFILELDSGEFELSSGRLPKVADDPEPEPEPKPGEPGKPVFLVSGEVGVGKSRLLREFKTHAQLRRVTVVEGHAGRGQGAYAAFVEVFRGVLALWSPQDESSAPRQNDPLRRRLLQRYGAEMARLMPELDEGSLPVGRAKLAPEQDELRLLDALAQFIIGYSRSRPLVILLHELEDADRETLALLSYLCRNLALIRSAHALSRRQSQEVRSLRLMVVGSYRPSELDPEQHTVIKEVLAHDTLVSQLSLEPLTPDETYTLIESMLGVDSEPRRLAERIFTETKGNPFFTVELMRSLVERGALKRQGGRWSINLDEAQISQLPETVSGVILERTRRTTKEEQAPLKALAVLGRASSIHELKALLGEDSPLTIGHLASLERRQVLYSVRRGSAWLYDFIHDVAREALYAEIPPDERVRLHQQCGDYLERRLELGTSSVDPGDLVRHFSAAGDRSRALTYGIQAGDEARAVHANSKAIGFYSQALSLLPSGSARWRDLLLRTGDLLARGGDYEKASQVYRRLLSPELAERVSDAERVSATRRLGEVLELQGDFDGALDALSEASATAYASDGLELESGALLAATASIYFQTGRYHDAIGFCEVGLRRLVGLSEGAETALVRTVLGRSRLALGELQQAEREFERCLAIHRRRSDEAGMAEALRDLGEVALQQGRIGEAMTRLEHAVERETALGHPSGVAKATRRLAEVCRRRCQFDRAASLLRRSLTIHRKTGNRAEAVRTLTQLAETCSAVGDYKLAFEHLVQAREEGEALGLLAVTAHALNTEARLRVRLGDRPRAAKRAEEALRQASLHGEVPRQRAAALETLGNAHLLGGELDQSELLLHQAQALFRKQEDQTGVLRTTLSILEIFLQRGDRDLAEAALKAVEEGPAPPEQERARLALLRVRASLQWDKRTINSSLLGHLERAAGLAEKARDAELAWEISATRGDLLVELDEPALALESYVEAMSGIRRLLEEVPAPLRKTFLELPACLRCRERFAALRRARAEAEGSP